MPPTTLEILAINITTLREQMSLTREALAEIVGSSASHISKLEHARTSHPGYFVIRNLAELFGVTSEALVETNLQELDQRQQAMRRLSVNFDDSEWDLLISMIDGVTRAQADQGRFRRY